MLDSTTHKIIISSISLTAIISVIGMIGLSAADKKIPPELNSAATGAIGALCGILYPSGSGRDIHRSN